MIWRGTFGSFCLSLFIFSIAGCHEDVSARPVGAAVTITPPLGLPAVPVPADNPPTEVSIALGHKLFYDTQVSVDGTIACSSCHDPRRYFTDGAPVSSGVGGQKGTRNAPTVLNAVYLPFQFWDGRAITLEQQAGSPIINPVEMQEKNHAAAVAKLQAESEYGPMFQRAFGSAEITIQRVENALASFERTLLSGNSPFDQYEFGGNKAALTQAQVRGLAVFRDPQRGNCAVCHTIGEHSALFTDGKFHNTGEGVGETGEFTDVGRYHETKVVTDTGAFLTPTLRNIANTAPYMHDGHLKTLKEVVDFYAGQGNSNAYLDPQMKSIHLTGRDREDLVEFLQSLTGTMPADSGPPQENATR
jgi:cytochrome c peroxidase